MEKTAVSSRSVNVAASEVNAYIASLPRLMTEGLSITVTGGPVPGPLELKNFYGPGFLWVFGSKTVVNGPIAVSGCVNYIRVGGFDVRGHISGCAVRIENSTRASLEGLAADGAKLSPAHSYPIGVYCGCHSNVHLSNCTIQNAAAALYCTDMAEMAAFDCAGSGNARGSEVYRGGIILLGGSTPDQMGGAANTKNGGLVVKANGTLL